MSNLVTTNRYSYHGPLGEVSHSGRYFFAWKDEIILIGAYETFDEAVEALVWRDWIR
jgi:hypothetical protein